MKLLRGQPFRRESVLTGKQPRVLMARYGKKQRKFRVLGKEINKNLALKKVNFLLVVGKHI